MSQPGHLRIISDGARSAPRRKIQVNENAERRRAVVIGASMAGLCAARVLAPQFDEVVIVERDDLGPTPADRKGVPQGRHAHALLLGGNERIEGWFPGIGEELLAAGALPFAWHRQMHFFQAGGLQVDAFDLGRTRALCSRAMLEHHVRRRVTALANVVLRKGAVAGLLSSDDRGTVTGVLLDSGESLPAGLVVDASGRAGTTVRFLEQFGYEPPRVSEVRMDMGYATRTFRRDPSDGRDFRLALVFDQPPNARMGVLFALEDDRWMVTLAGFHGDHPTTDEDAWVEFARSLPDPVVAEVIAESEPLTPIVTHRMVASQRRHVEHMQRCPGGLVLLGDSVASFNPIYGQGMTSAMMQAEQLGAVLERHRDLGPRFVRDYHRRAGRAVENPWRMSVGADFALPQTTGPKPRGTDLIGRYMQRVLRASHSDPVVLTRFREVTNLLRPPAALITPAIALRVLRASRKAPAPVAVRVPALARH
jgi:2-polyprenyl-6-methoxyphenol hydroxylase-like FAD-dependent oxidoreductase